MIPIENYFGQTPSHQNAFDIFKGEWSTRLPDASGLVASDGPGRFCEDYRLIWGCERVGGFVGKNILELGPLEGGHSVLLEKMGAASITAIEANSKAYLKCLIMKEAFGLSKAKYFLGDFLPYLESRPTRFDCIIACGVLYHLLDPVAAIRLMAESADTVLVWTHYFDEAYLASEPGAGHRFLPTEQVSSGGVQYSSHMRLYGESLAWGGFCGGGADRACWLSLADLFAAFRHFGMEIVESVLENNPNGPAVLFAARKIGAAGGDNIAFPEQAYLARYPDVKAAIAAGIFKSGAHHYQVCGALEGRIR